MVAPLVLDERYRLVKQLRQSEDVALFLVRDLPWDRMVALKVFLAPDEQALRSYQKHLQLLATLSHPHIARTIDSGTIKASDQFLFGKGEGTYLYLATEFLPGPNLQAAFPPESLLRQPVFHAFLTAAAQICDALDYVHRRHLVHLDIKPENILLAGPLTTGEMAAKLIDFDLSQTVSTPLGVKVRGTLPLISPEVLNDSVISEKADLYSLGATLYLVATGELPFSSSSDRGLMKRILWTPPAPLDMLAPQLPSGFAALIADLLQKRPDRRPPSARDVKTRIAALQLKSAAEVASDAAADPGDEDAGLIGRNTAFRQLAGEIDNLCNGEPLHRVLILRGETGCGRHQMLVEIERYASLKGVDIVATNAALPARHPFEPLEQVVAQLRLPPRETLPPPQRAAYDALTGRASLPDPPASVPEALARRGLLFNRLAELLLAATAQRTTLLVFEHLDAADPALVQFIAHVANLLQVRARRYASGRSSNGSSTHILIGATIGSVAPAASPAALESVLMADVALTVTLEHLDLQTTEEILRASSGGAQLDATTITAIQHITGGHPLYLHDICGMLRRLPPDLFLRRLQELPEGVAGYVLNLLEQTDAHERAVVAVLALCNAPLPLDMLAACAGVSAERIQACAATAGLVHVRRGAVSLRWPHRDRTVFLGAVEDTATLVVRTAEECARRGLDGHAARLLAPHAPEKAVMHALAAADASMKVFAWEGAASIAREVLQHAGARHAALVRRAAELEKFNQAPREALALLEQLDAEARADPATRLDTALLHAECGAREDALQLIEEMLSTEGDAIGAEVRLRAELARAELHIAQGQPERAETLLAAAVGNAGTFPELEAYAWRLLGRAGAARRAWPTAHACFTRAAEAYERLGRLSRAGRDLCSAGDACVGRGDFASALGLFRRAAALAQEHGDRLLEALAHHKLGTAHYRRGETGEALSHLDAAHVLWEELDEPRNLADSLNNTGLVYRSNGDLAGAVRFFQESLKILSDLEDEEGQAAVLNNLASVLDAHGRYRDALTQSFKALELRKRQRDPSGIAFSHFRIAWIYRHLGELDHAISFARRSHDLREKVGDRLGMAHTLFLLGDIDVLQGRLGEGLHKLRQSLVRFQALGDVTGKAPLLLTLARLYHATGADESAEEFTAQCERLAEEHHMTAYRAEAQCLRAHFKHAEGDLYGAQTLLTDAERLLEGDQDRKLRAEILLVRAHALLDLGSGAKAEDALERAYSVMSEIDARDLAPRYFLLRAKAVLAAPDASVETAERLLARALGEAQDIGALPLVARLHLEFAALCRRKDAVQAGREHVAHAEEIFRQIHDDLPIRLQRTFEQSRLGRWVRDEIAWYTRDPQVPPPSAPVADEELAAAREHARNLERLQGITQALNSELILDKVLTRIIDAALELANAERGFLIIGAGKEQRFQVARNLLGETVSDPAQEISQSIAREVLHTGRPLVTNDAVGDVRLARFKSVRDLKLMSIACLPLNVKDITIGTLYLDNRTMKNAFRSDDLSLLTTLCSQAAIAIENARLIEENQRKQQALEESNARIAALNRRLTDKLREKTDALKQAHTLLGDRFRLENIIGKSKAMQEVFHLIHRVATTNLPVLIEGESGTGKELIANAIHFHSARRSQPIISENCGALTATILESELFGHERGAFTGAVREKKGLFELAHRGTLFLDEIGDMDLDMQKKLLRVLEEGEIRRVGGKHIIKVDVRLLTATNHRLSTLVSQERFREDLYWRLNVIRIVVPPLRERREDIPLLSEHFLARIARVQNEEPKRLSQEALRRLLDYHWPGNVRELQHFLERMHLLAGGPVIEKEDVVMDGDASPPPVPFATPHGTLKNAREDFTKWFLAGTLREHGGVVSRAARSCGISRETFHRLLKKHDVSRPDAP